MIFLVGSCMPDLLRLTSSGKAAPAQAFDGFEAMEM